MRTCIQILGLLAISAAVTFGQDAPEAKGKGKGNPEKMFKKLDADADGSISLDEFKASPRGAKNPDKASAAFSKMDADSSGSVTLEEFKSFKPAKGKGGEKGAGKKGKKGKKGGAGEAAE